MKISFIKFYKISWKLYILDPKFSRIFWWHCSIVKIKKKQLFFWKSLDSDLMRFVSFCCQSLKTGWKISNYIKKCRQEAHTDDDRRSKRYFYLNKELYWNKNVYIFLPSNKLLAQSIIFTIKFFLFLTNYKRTFTKIGSIISLFVVSFDNPIAL